MAAWKDADENIRLPKHWTPDARPEPKYATQSGEPPDPDDRHFPWVLTAEDRTFLRVQRIAPDELVDDGA